MNVTKLLYQDSLLINEVIHVMDSKTTPIVLSNHPYVESSWSYVKQRIRA